MTGRKRIGAVLAAMTLLALAVAGTTRAQRAPSGANAAEADKKELRDRLVELRTSVALLQVEHEAARESLLSALREQAKLDSEGWTPEIGARAAARAQSQVMTYFFDAVAGKAPKTEQTAEKAADEMASSVAEDIQQTGEANRKVVDRATKKFTKATRRLHDKRLELAEAEVAFARCR